MSAHPIRSQQRAADDDETNRKSPRKKFAVTPAMQARIVRLASAHSVLQVSTLPGMPGAAVIYQALGSDVAFATAFSKANARHHRARCDAFAEFRSRKSEFDLGLILVALRKLKRWAAKPLPLAPHLDFSMLTDDELQGFEDILAKVARRGVDDGETSP